MEMNQIDIIPRGVFCNIGLTIQVKRALDGGPLGGV